MSHISKDRVSRINLSITERSVLAAGAAALLLTAANRRSVPGRVVLAAAAGALVYKSATGHSDVYRLLGVRPVHRGRHREQLGLYVTHTITIGRPPEELYVMWRDLSRLPEIFRHLEDVRVLDERRSHWKAKGPFGKTMEWDSEITLDVPNQEIHWQSARDAEFPNRGIVRFERAPAERGTALRVQMIYDPPAGKLGAALASVLGDDPQTRIKEDLRRLKQRIETGEVPTTEGQPSGPR